MHFSPVHRTSSSAILRELKEDRIYFPLSVEETPKRINSSCHVPQRATTLSSGALMSSNILKISNIASPNSHEGCSHLRRTVRERQSFLKYMSHVTLQSHTVSRKTHILYS